MAGRNALKFHWKRTVRPAKRRRRFSDFELAHDPLEGVWVEWDLDGIINDLAADVIAGRYRAEPARIIRSTKSQGLTRPLAFLQPRDQILYRALVSSAQASLQASSFEWTSFGRGDGDEEEASAPESGWFRAWLKRQKALWTITEGHPLIVETDVANFFPTVDVRFVIDHVNANSSLDTAAVRLLHQLLQAVAPQNHYRAPAGIGLPQEGLDCSRILAHSYLRPVDEEFAALGAKKAYSRFMDDIAIGVSSEPEALKVISRAQKALEGVGLYVNSVKTRVIASDEFRLDYMKEANDQIGEWSDEVKDKGVTPALRADIEESIARHLALKQRPKAWGRVLRRLFSLSRAVDSSYLADRVFRLLQEDPGSADHYFEYLRGFQLTEHRVAELRAAMETYWKVYDDVALLFYEYVNTAPNKNDAKLRARLTAMAKEEVGRSSHDSPYLQAAAVVTMGRFGTENDLDWLLSRNHQLSPDSPAGIQARAVLFGAGRVSVGDIAGATARTFDARYSTAYLSALGRGDDAAVNVALGICGPTSAGVPSRPVINPRAAFLVPVLRTVATEKVTRVEGGWKKILESARPRHRDAAGRRWLFDV